MTAQRKLSPLLAAVLAGSALISAAANANAQTTVEELTVTGRYGPAPDNAQSLSQAVSYADLDLSTTAGRHELRRRIHYTARYLCDKLGESETSGPLAPSCMKAAESDAMARAGTLEESFVPRGTTWVAGPAWAPPYPTDWYTRYPYQY